MPVKVLWTLIFSLAFHTPHQTDRVMAVGLTSQAECITTGLAIIKRDNWDFDAVAIICKPSISKDIIYKTDGAN